MRSVGVPGRSLGHEHDYRRAATVADQCPSRKANCFALHPWSRPGGGFPSSAFLLCLSSVACTPTLVLLPMTRAASPFGYDFVPPSQRRPTPRRRHRPLGICCSRSRGSLGFSHCFLCRPCGRRPATCRSGCIRATRATNTTSTTCSRPSSASSTTLSASPQVRRLQTRPRPPLEAARAVHPVLPALGRVVEQRDRLLQPQAVHPLLFYATLAHAFSLALLPPGVSRVWQSAAAASGSPRSSSSRSRSG